MNTANPSRRTRGRRTVIAMSKGLGLVLAGLLTATTIITASEADDWAAGVPGVPDVTLTVSTDCGDDTGYSIRLLNTGERRRTVYVKIASVGTPTRLTYRLRPRQSIRDEYRVTTQVRVVYRSQRQVLMRAALTGGCRMNQAAS